MSRPAGIFLASIAGLAAISALIAAWRLDFNLGDELRGALLGIAAGVFSTALTYFLQERALTSSNLGFLRTYFLGMLLRVIVLAAGAVIVWGIAGWSLKHYLIAVGLTYPLFLVLEARLLSRSLGVERAARTRKA